MPLITPRGGADSETSTLVNFSLDEGNLGSYVLEPLSQGDAQEGSDLEGDNTAWSNRPKKQKKKSQPASTMPSRLGRDAAVVWTVVILASTYRSDVSAIR